MKKFLILSFLNSSFVFAQAPSLDCHLSNGTEKRQSSSPLLDGQSEVKGEELGFLFDASLASQSYLSIFEDQEKERRVAFAGSPEATSGSGSKLTIGNASLQCVQKSPSIGFQIPEIGRAHV